LLRLTEFFHGIPGEDGGKERIFSVCVADFEKHDSKEHFFDGSRKLISLKMVTLDPGRSRAKERVFVVLSDHFLVGKIVSEEPKSYEYLFGQSLGVCTVSMKEKPTHDMHCIELNVVSCVCMCVCVYMYV